MGNFLSCASQNNSEDKVATKKIEEFDHSFSMGSVLGVGQFSEVKKAKGHQRELAVKCISLANMKGETKLLQREMAIMKKIRHPNIIELYDIYENSDFIYITMEICSKGSLKERVSKDGPIPLPELKLITAKLLSALRYLHSKNICHRDIKPENILFTERDVKIADFGLARFMDGTNKFTMVGTPYYLSPEVIFGDYNMKCDIWSLGVVIYYALTGRLPFYGEGYEDLFQRISNSEIDYYGINESEQEFLRYIMRKDQKLRPTAEEALKNEWITSELST